MAFPARGGADLFRPSLGVRLQGSSMVTVFDKREDEYIAWVLANQDGFVANVDRDQNVPQYPMAHKASHKLMWSPKIGNFTTGDYVKFCASSLEELDQYARK